MAGYWALLKTCLVAALGFICGPFPNSTQAQEGWEFTFSPMVLAPSIEGRSTIGRSGGDISVDPGDVLDNLDAGGALRFQGHHPSGFGYALDYSVMNLAEGASSLAGRISADIDQSVLDAVGSYRFETGTDVMEIYAGLRYWDVDFGLNVTGGPLAGLYPNGDSWIDPLVGLRWQRQIGAKWRLMLDGGIGGFGIGSDFTWNLMGGVAYERWDNISLFAMYRALGVDYETGTPGTASYFEYDTVSQGPLVGVGFRF